jgi:ParB/RepB/Spo0J family partition protein
MILEQENDMEIIHVPLDRLDFADEDIAIRKTAVREAIKPLAKNIERFGLLVPLLVRANGEDRFEVIDGNRRLAALGLIDADPARLITCVLGSPAEASQGAALAANLMRQAMNPVDAHDVFKQMIASGMKPREIAKTFGKKQKEVQQILALAALHEEIKQALRQGELAWETAKALTLIKDMDRQVVILKSCGDNAYAIRSATLNAQPNLAYALFEKERYFSEGGVLIIDLFGRDPDEDYEREQICADSEIFWRLQHEEIEKKIEELQAEGWKGVATIQTEKVNWQWPGKDEIRTKKARSEHWLFYRVEPDGEFKIVDRVKPLPEALEKAKAKAAKQKLAAAEQAAEPIDMAAGKPLSHNLLETLKEARWRQVRAALAGNESLAGKVFLTLLNWDRRAGQWLDPRLPGTAPLIAAILREQPIHARMVWSPDAAFWKSSGRAFMLKILEEMVGEAIAARYKNEKVIDLAKRMETWFRAGDTLRVLDFGGQSDAPIAADLVQKLKNWTPAILALPVEGPGIDRVFETEEPKR